MPIIVLEEENLRLDSQDGVPGMIPETELTVAYAALYVQVPQHIQRRVQQEIAIAVKQAAIDRFAVSMKALAQEATHPEPDGWYSLRSPGG